VKRVTLRNVFAHVARHGRSVIMRDARGCWWVSATAVVTAQSGLGFRSNLLVRSERAKVWNRRIAPIGARSGEGPLTEPTAAAQDWRQEPRFMPQTRPFDLSSAAATG
jgi:hypothetical protein